MKNTRRFKHDKMFLRNEARKFCRILLFLELKVKDPLGVTRATSTTGTIVVGIQWIKKFYCPRPRASKQSSSPRYVALAESSPPERRCTYGVLHQLFCLRINNCTYTQYLYVIYIHKWGSRSFEFAGQQQQQQQQQQREKAIDAQRKDLSGRKQS